MIGVELIDRLGDAVEAVVHDAKRRLPRLAHADVRLEVAEAKYASAENGGAKASGDDYGIGLGVRVLAGSRAIAPGYVGRTLGAADTDDLPRIVREAIEQAWRRADVNGEMKADARDKLGPLGESLADTRLHPVEIRRDTIAAVYEVDPRTVPLATMVREATGV
jgi:hypothetical protein